MSRRIVFVDQPTYWRRVRHPLAAHDAWRPTKRRRRAAPAAPALARPRRRKLVAAHAGAAHLFLATRRGPAPIVKPLPIRRRRPRVVPASTTPALITATFLHHYTGVLVPDSKLLANQHTNAQLFEQFVPFPVDLATYEAKPSPIDITFTDTFRFYASALHATLGRGVTGAVALKMQVDDWASGGSDPNVFQDWSVGTLTARYVRTRIVMSLGNAPGAGAPAYVDAFTPAADKSVNSQSSGGVVAVAPGGTAITFAVPYHNLPAVNVTGQDSGSGPLVGWYSSLTTTGFIMHLGPDTSHDIGGNGSWASSGV